MSFKNIFFLLITIILVTGCVFTEELYINNNGSGKYSFKMDMSKMIESMNNMSPKDSLKEPEKIDTIIYFKDLLEKNKDSINQLPEKDKELLESLKDFKIHMHMNQETNKMIMDFNVDFKKLQELKNMEERIAKIQALNDKKEEPVPSKADVSYHFKNKTFHREVILKNLSEEELNKIEKTLEQSSSFLDGSIYKVVYHFEDEIKNVSIDDAKISNDKKTLIIQMPMDSLVKNPKLLDFEVKLK